MHYYPLVALTVLGGLLLAVAAAARGLAPYSPHRFGSIARHSQGFSLVGLSLVTCVLLAWAIAAGVA